MTRLLLRIVDSKAVMEDQGRVVYVQHCSVFSHDKVFFNVL